MMAGMTGNGGGGAVNVPVVNNPLGSPFDNIMGSEWNSQMNTLPQQSQQDPLSNLMDSVNSLDPLNSLGKSLNEQVGWTEQQRR